MAARKPRGFFSPLFLICAAVLLAAGLGMHPALAALFEHYGKEPIGLRRELPGFVNEHLPSFVYVPGDYSQSFIGDTEAIGTEDIIFYQYEYLPNPGEHPTALFVTYYSDPRDSIPHTPEVCYRQGGAVVESIETVRIETPELAPEIPEIEARLLDITQGPYRATIIYVICCNGRMHSGRESARWQISWPGDKYVYFSKVEIITHQEAGQDRREAVERCKQLMREALPILVDEYYPSNDSLR